MLLFLDSGFKQVMFPLHFSPKIRYYDNQKKKKTLLKVKSREDGIMDECMRPIPRLTF